MVFPITNKNFIVKPRNKSQGYLKDLAYLALANSFFKNSLNDSLKDNPFLIPALNSDKILYQEVKEELRNLSLKIDSTIESPENTLQDSKKYDSYCSTLSKTFLRLAHLKSVSYELVGIYVIYSRFLEKRVKKIDDKLSFIQDRKKLMSLADKVLALEVEEDSIEWIIASKLSKVL